MGSLWPASLDFTSFKRVVLKEKGRTCHRAFVWSTKPNIFTIWSFAKKSLLTPRPELKIGSNLLNTCNRG